MSHMFSHLLNVSMQVERERERERDKTRDPSEFHFHQQLPSPPFLSISTSDLDGTLTPMCVSERVTTLKEVTKSLV